MLRLVLAASQMHPQFEETNTIERVLVDVRVTNDDGVPVTALTADDFIVKIGRAATRVDQPPSSMSRLRPSGATGSQPVDPAVSSS